MTGRKEIQPEPKHSGGLWCCSESPQVLDLQGMETAGAEAHVPAEKDQGLAFLILAFYTTKDMI